MNIKSLKDKDKGREVRYTSDSGSTIERGEIVSWDKVYVYVNYLWSEKPEPLTPITCTEPVATSPANLEFII